jgi:hypothetical protein
VGWGDARFESGTCDPCKGELQISKCREKTSGLHVSEGSAGTSGLQYMYLRARQLTVNDMYSYLGLGRYIPEGRAVTSRLHVPQGRVVTSAQYIPYSKNGKLQVAYMGVQQL